MTSVHKGWRLVPLLFELIQTFGKSAFGAPAKHIHRPLGSPTPVAADKRLFATLVGGQEKAHLEANQHAIGASGSIGVPHLLLDGRQGDPH